MILEKIKNANDIKNIPPEAMMLWQKKSLGVFNSEYFQNRGTSGIQFGSGGADNGTASVFESAGG